MHNLARIRIALGEHADARRLIEECLEVTARVGYREVLAYTVEMVAELVFAAGDAERALRLLAVAESLFAQTGARMQGDELTSYERLVADVRERLGDDAVETARALADRVLPDVARAEALAALSP